MRLAIPLLLAAVFLIPAASTATDIPELEALRSGDMKKLVFASAPEAVSDIEFGHLEGTTHKLSDFQSQVLLVNFWATWCAPCRKEMPGLEALQTSMGGEDFQVVTIATGRNSPTGMRKFFEEIGVSSLPLYIDPKQKLARDMAVLGLPITVIVDRKGQEIARLRGDADWDSDSARAILSAVIAEP